MPPTPYRLLLLDTNFVTRIALTSRLEAMGYMVRAEKTVGTAARAASSSHWDLVLASVSVPPADLEAFLETLAMTDCPSTVCVIVDAGDKTRKDVATRYRARSIVHPFRPQSLVEFLPARPPHAGESAQAGAFFRTA